MGVDGIGEVGDRASEGQAAGVYGAGFTAGSLAGKGARGGKWGMGNKISFDKELMEVIISKLIKITMFVSIFSVKIAVPKFR